MSSFLECVQTATRESRTASGVQPSTVINQTGRLLKFVNWTIAAWKEIQNSRAHWEWMKKEFSEETSIGAPRYTANGWAIADFARWVGDNVADDYYPTTLYLSATGVSDEGVIRQISWRQWRTTYGRGSQTNRRPINYAISPQNEFCVGPTPDAVFTVKGEYFETAQILAADEDIPNLPVRFHDIIPYRALILMSEHDEALTHIAACRGRYAEMMSDLQRDQLPPSYLSGEPLA